MTSKRASRWPPEPGALVLADPDFDGKAGKAGPRSAVRSAGSLRQTHWARLLGTADEARGVKPALLKYLDRPPEIFLGADSTEGRFEAAKRPRVVLISTHGFYLDDQALPAKQALALSAGAAGLKLRTIENPLLRCGLVLAGANRPRGADADGYLTGLEILGIDLRATELVVLSACETGLGEVRQGQGVAGLRQAFQLAGAGSVLATLWPIPDKESALLVLPRHVICTTALPETYL